MYSMPIALLYCGKCEFKNEIITQPEFTIARVAVRIFWLAVLPALTHIILQMFVFISYHTGKYGR